MLRLLQINHPAIKRVGSGLMKPIIALIAKRELSQVPQLLKLTLQCISVGVKSLSSVILSSLNTSICDFILDRLASEMDILTHNPLLISTSMIIVDGGYNGSKKKNNKRDSKGNNSNNNSNNNSSSSSSSSSGGGGNQAVQSKGGISTHRFPSYITDNNQGMNNNSNNCNDDDHRAAIMYCNEASRCRWLGILFEASESILVYCRHMLSSAVRERYSIIIRQGLMNLSLGIIPSLYYDRHMQRQQACAPIRSDVIVQSMLLQLATVEVFIPNSKQQYSQNLSLLQKAAELCMQSTATAPAASKALMTISTLLQPTTVALPTIPIIDQARDFILQSNQQSRGHDNRVISSSSSSCGVRGFIGEHDVVHVDAEVDSDETKHSKRQKTIEVTNIHQDEVEIVVIAVDQDEMEVEMDDHDKVVLDEANGKEGVDNADENELSALQIKMPNLHSNDSSDGNQIVRDAQVLKTTEQVYASNDDIHCTDSDVAGSIVAKHFVQKEILDHDAAADDDDSLPDIDIDADPDVN